MRKRSSHGSFYKSTITLRRTYKSIPVERGTIKGDTLSPILILIYTEPLLRWHVGGRGYEHGCTMDIQPQTDLERLANRISSGAFVDDLIMSLHQNRSPRTSRKAIPLLGPHCLRVKAKGDRRNPQCRQAREHKQRRYAKEGAPQR